MGICAFFFQSESDKRLRRYRLRRRNTGREMG